ncbi:uncharacterized protein BDV17DRAFT_294544 [Aspergillus undulatus]|uniref:uncharacterized protein n=1 Tax=Aspergillus undulatus TaxID=1810928 RepID=UPI003CCDFF52
MRFTAALLTLAAVIGGTAAETNPLPIRICNGINMKGDCINENIYLQHQCYNLNGTPVYGNVRSVSIPAGHRCRFWQSTVCNGDGTGDIQAPGTDSTSYVQNGSVKCYANN